MLYVHHCQSQIKYLSVFVRTHYLPKHYVSQLDQHWGGLNLEPTDCSSQTSTNWQNNWHFQCRKDKKVWKWPKADQLYFKRQFCTHMLVTQVLIVALHKPTGPTLRMMFPSSGRPWGAAQARKQWAAAQPRDMLSYIYIYNTNSHKLCSKILLCTLQYFTPKFTELQVSTKILSSSLFYIIMFSY